MSSQCLSNTFLPKKPIDARTTGQPLATLMLVIVVVATVKEAKEILKVVREEGSDMEKQYPE